MTEGKALESSLKSKKNKYADWFYCAGMLDDTPLHNSPVMIDHCPSQAVARSIRA
jgi:hypothetical protein